MRRLDGPDTRGSPCRDQPQLSITPAYTHRASSPHLASTRQSMFTIVVPVRHGHRDTLESLLASMTAGNGLADPRNPIIPFAHFPTLHAARLLFLESLCGDEIRAFGVKPHEFPVSLTLAGEVDGDETAFLAELATRARTGLEQLFSHCEGFDRHQGSLLSWLQRHNIAPAASYFYWPGRTVQRIREDAALHRSLRDALPVILEETDRENIRDIRQRLLEHVQLEQHAGRLVLTPEPSVPWRERLANGLHIVTLPLTVILLSPLLLVGAPVFLWRLRSLERSDPKIDTRPAAAHIAALSVVEDHDVTNSFNVFGDIKPGRFRRYTAMAVMSVVNWFARHVYNRGYLGRVRTIHAARWVWLDDHRSMCFMSQYDGSLESYMDDFINKVSFGLNLTFSHGVGYPSTRWMLKGGAELEEPFKNTLRRHQLPSRVWYRAHPGLTAFDMARNARLRDGLDHYPASDRTLRRWLAEI